MPEELMPTEIQEPPKPKTCPNCGKVGGNCSELDAQCKEIESTQRKLNEKKAEHIKEIQSINMQMKKNREVARKLRQKIQKRRRVFLQSQLAEQRALKNSRAGNDSTPTKTAEEKKLIAELRELRQNRRQLRKSKKSKRQLKSARNGGKSKVIRKSAKPKKRSRRNRANRKRN